MGLLRQLGLVVVASLVGCSRSNPLASWILRPNASSFGVPPGGLFASRDDVEFDQTDLSFITALAAIGDSYSAGIGAGDRLGNVFQFLDAQSDYACSRYDESYPYLINTDARLGDPSTRTFQFKSCSGAVIADVLKEQIPNISGNQQVILLSAGGNDVGLTKILNQCIFQWAVLTPAQVAVAKAAAILDEQYQWAQNFDWDSLGIGCEGQLALTQSLIASSGFGSSLDSVIAAARAKLGPSGMLYYTGYAKFWDETLTSACDSVTWTTWIYKAVNVFQPAQRLTTAHRSTMNSLVDAINAQISAAVDRAGAQVKFVNYDSYVGYFNGRYCTPGVDESTTESNTRADLMFYELNSWDPEGNTPWKRGTDGSLNGTFEGDLGIFTQITLLMDPDAELNDQPLIVGNDAVATAKVKVSDTDGSGVEIPNILPDGYGRVFHPQVLLHQIIAGLVIYEMVNLNEQNNGFPAIPETLEFSSCPYYPPAPGSGSTNVTSGGQQIALVSYINPLADPAAWDRMISYPDDKVSVLMANVNNGPDSTVDASWMSVISRANAAGKRVIGYVRTGYLGVSGGPYRTRLGSNDLASWIAQIQGDVDLWYQLYPGLIGGIFFDEGWNDCGSDNEYSELYRLISDTTKRKYPGAFTVINPGAPMPQCFENSADTLVTYEGNYTIYLNSYAPNPDWTPSDARKIWHIIYDVPAANAADVAALALERQAGLIHVTDDTQPNPYDTLPADAYMQTVMNSVFGGGPLVEDPLPFPADGARAPEPPALVVNGADYTSVSLSWDVSSVPYAWKIVSSITGTQRVVLPGTISGVTIGNFQPGTSSFFLTLTAIGEDGSESSGTTTRSISTLSLPNNQPITNISAIPTSSSTTITAQVLVPFAFLRIFITNPDTHCSLPAWPINYDTGDFICAQYMVEDGTLFRYSGANLTDGETDYAWAWTAIGDASPVQNGYTFTWVLPIGDSSIDTNYFIVQGQGYGPFTNFFHPCPSTWGNTPTLSSSFCTGQAPYDCKGETLCSTMNVKWCDEAVNRMQRGSSIYKANGGALADSGNCWANWEQFGCSVQIRGTDENGANCQITGDDMWDAYQDIRSIGGCSKCGSKHFGNGCLVSVDYYYGCDNRDPGPNRED